MIIGQNDKSPNIFQKIFNLNVKFDYFLRDDSNYLIIGNERNGVAATGIIPIIKTSLFKKILVTEELNLNQIKSSIKDKKTIIFHLSEFDFNKNLINSPSCLSNFINFFNITEEDLIDSDVIIIVYDKKFNQIFYNKFVVFFLIYFHSIYKDKFSLIIDRVEIIDKNFFKNIDFLLRDEKLKFNLILGYYWRNFYNMEIYPIVNHLNHYRIINDKSILHKDKEEILKQIGFIDSNIKNIFKIFNDLTEEKFILYSELKFKILKFTKNK